MIRNSKQTDLDRQYLKLALSKRKMSDDPNSKLVAQSGVVAVIVRSDEVLSISANVLPPKLKSKFTAENLTVNELLRYDLIEHAERAAIYGALLHGSDLTNATLYCTRFPCSDCARAIIWSGITRIVTLSGFANESRWLASQKAALDMMRSVGITVRYLSIE
jgi:deoxycytidylate deaminase